MNKAVVSLDMSERERVAVETNNCIVNIKQIAEENYLELAKYLYEMFEKALYQELGFSHFSEYLKSPDVNIEYRKANRLIETYKVFVLKYNVDKPLLLSAGYSKLYLIHNQVNDENLDEWMGKAVSCTRKDLEAEVSDKGDEELEVPEYFNWEAFGGQAMKFIFDLESASVFNNRMSIALLADLDELKTQFEKGKKVKRL